jgi:hypothetical protein
MPRITENSYGQGTLLPRMDCHYLSQISPDILTQWINQLLHFLKYPAILNILCITLFKEIKIEEKHF